MLLHTLTSINPRAGFNANLLGFRSKCSFHIRISLRELWDPIEAYGSTLWWNSRAHFHRSAREHSQRNFLSCSWTMAKATEPTQISYISKQPPKKVLSQSLEGTWWIEHSTFWSTWHVTMGSCCWELMPYLIQESIVSLLVCEGVGPTHLSPSETNPVRLDKYLLHQTKEGLRY